MSSQNWFSLHEKSSSTGCPKKRNFQNHHPASLHPRETKFKMSWIWSLWTKRWTLWNLVWKPLSFCWWVSMLSSQDYSFWRYLKACTSGIDFSLIVLDSSYLTRLCVWCCHYSYMSHVFFIWYSLIAKSYWKSLTDGCEWNAWIGWQAGQARLSELSPARRRRRLAAERANPSGQGRSQPPSLKLSTTD